jgi:sugar lactone lactonase YvrE
MLSRISIGSLVLLGAASFGCSSEEPCDPTAPGTICTVVGSGEQGFGGDNGPALEAALYVPQDTAVSPDGELWVLDFNNYLIRAVDDQGIIRSVVGTGLLGDSPPVDVAQIPAAEALFNHTTDLFFHDGYLYLAAWHNSRIKRVKLDTMMLENFAGIGRRTLYSGDGGPALSAAVDLPSSIALDPNGNIVFMDQANQVVRMVDQDGIIHRIAGTCLVEYTAVCGPSDVPVACPDSNKTTCGAIEENCNLPCTPGYGGDGGSALDARMAQPFGQRADPAGRLTYDAEGNLYFADSQNHRIRKVDTNGIITTAAGTGTGGYSGDGGPANEADIFNPVDVEVADDGRILFTDVYNNCVRAIETDGTISTVAGVCSPDTADRAFGGDGGPPTEARLDRPYGIEIDGDLMYIADSYNNRIRVVVGY